MKPQFNRLSVRVAHILSVAATVLVTAAIPGRADLVIDSFNTDQTVGVQGTPAGFMSAADATLAAGALGGERDIYVERTSGNAGAVSTDVNLSQAGALSYNSGPATTGNALIVWDGIDGSATNLNATGLGGVDLTLGGANNAIAIRAGADLNASLVLTIYKNATNYSTFTQPVTGNGEAMANFLIPFSSFTVAGGSGADFTSVGAISLKIVGSTADMDMLLESIKAVPEPTAGLLVGLTVVAAGVTLKRKYLRV